MAPFPARIDPRIVQLWKERGISELYRHQAQAIEAALDGKDVLVATPTASGKTICYTAPVLQALHESNGAARALFLYPTKALSQDQSAGLTDLVERLGAEKGNVVLLHNPRRIQSAAVNLAVERFGDGADILVRCDAHAGYPRGYIARLVATLDRVGADAVVVPMDSV